MDSHSVFAVLLTWFLNTNFASAFVNDDARREGFTKMYENTKYELESDMATWDHAQGNCTLEFKRLATPTNMTYHHVISGELLLHAKNAEKVWIGGRAKPDAKYSWTNGQDFGGDTSNFADVAGRSMCVYMQVVQGSFRLSYNSEVCDQTKAIICEHPGATCLADSSTALQLPSRCLTFHTESLTWYGARDYCAREPGSRLWVTASGTPKGILGFIGQNQQLKFRSFWIGLSKMKWIWEDGSPMFDYAQLWSQRSETEATGCVAMEMQTGGVYTWAQEPCSTLLPYVCESNTTMGLDEDMDSPEPEPKATPEPEKERDGNSPTFRLGVLLHLTTDVWTDKGPYILLGAVIGVAIMLVPLAITCCVCFRYRAGATDTGTRWSFRSRKPDPYAAVWSTADCRSISEAAPPRYPGHEGPTAPPPSDYQPSDDHLYEAPPDVAQGAYEDPGTWPKSQGRVI